MVQFSSFWFKSVEVKLENGKICFNLSFVPEQERLNKLVKLGVPIMLWPRLKEQKEMAQKLHEQLSSHPLRLLPELLRKARKDIWSNCNMQHIGHLSLLWDDPERQPPKKRLGAPSRT